MKKELGHISIFILLIILVTSGGFFAYSQVQNDLDANLLGNRSDHFDRQVHQSALDTLRFLVDPSYEYCEFSCDVDEKSTCEKLSKTVVTIKEEGLKNNFSASEMNKLPANASINLMFETYSVSRRTDSCSTIYQVTVESFDTYLESIGKEMDIDVSAFQPLSREEIHEAMRSGKSIEWVKKISTDPRPF